MRRLKGQSLYSWAFGMPADPNNMAVLTSQDNDLIESLDLSYAGLQSVLNRRWRAPVLNIVAEFDLVARLTQIQSGWLFTTKYAPIYHILYWNESAFALSSGLSCASDALYSDTGQEPLASSDNRRIALSEAITPSVLAEMNRPRPSRTDKDNTPWMLSSEGPSLEGLPEIGVLFTNLHLGVTDLGWRWANRDVNYNELVETNFQGKRQFGAVVPGNVLPYEFRDYRRTGPNPPDFSNKAVDQVSAVDFTGVWVSESNLRALHAKGIV